MKKEPILELRGVGKQYNGNWIIQNLNMKVNRGEIYGFLGNNGAGKTTTIRMIMGLIQPTAGDILLFNRTQDSLGKNVYRRIGAVIEYPGFYPNLTAKENLLHNALLIGIPDPAKKIDEVLSLIGLKSDCKILVKNYSLGMKQRLGIARTLLHEPELILLDEPTNGLDPAGIHEVRKIILELAKMRNLTVFISSHILSEVEQLATRVGIVHNGQLVEELSISELKNQGKQYIEIKPLNPTNAVRLLEEKLSMKNYKVLEDGTLRLFECLDNPSLVNRILIENGVDISLLQVREESLEQHFISLTGGKRK